jgi:hypothetical protein
MSETNEPTGTSVPVVERVLEADREKLRFLRWLAEQGRLEHQVCGPPSGEYAS